MNANEPLLKCRENVFSVKTIGGLRNGRSVADGLNYTGYTTDVTKGALRWSCLAGHFFCQISKQILFKTEDGEIHPLVVNRSLLGVLAR